MSALSIRDVAPDDIGAVHVLLGQTVLGDRWALDAASIGPQRMSSLMWHEVAYQNIVQRDEGGVVGILQMHDYDALNGIGYLSGILPADEHESELALLARAFLLDCLRAIPARKLYVHSVVGRPDMGSRLLGDLLVHEGTIPDAMLLAGQPQALTVWGLWTSGIVASG